MIPRAGTRHTLVTFETPAMVPDAHGGQVVQQWLTVAEAWCQLKTLSARERMAAQRLEVFASHVLTVPWCEELAQISTEERVNLNGRRLNIVSVINTDEMNEELVMLAEEGVPT